MFGENLCLASPARALSGSCLAVPIGCAHFVPPAETAEVMTVLRLKLPNGLAFLNSMHEKSFVDVC